MLTIEIPTPKTPIYDEKTNQFFEIRGGKIQLEHSLISLRKWESKWHKPFLDRTDHTQEESIDYIRCMTLTQNVDPNAYYLIPENEVQKIMDYIQDPRTATWFGGDKLPGSKRRPDRIITAEVIYYWMIELGIPIELEKWHLNQLITLIRVINAERTPKKKRSQRDVLNQYSKLNALRRAKSGSTG